MFSIRCFSVVALTSLVSFAIGAGLLRAQNSNVHGLLQAYKDQNPQAAAALEHKRQQERQSSTGNPDPHTTMAYDTTQPLYNNLPYQPQTQAPPVSIPPPFPSQQPIAGVPVPYYPNHISPLTVPQERTQHNVFERVPSIPADQSGANAYRGIVQQERERQPGLLPMGGNPKDPLNLQFTPDWASKPNRPKTSYDEMHGDARLNDVFFLDARYGWVVGDHGTIWHTADGGVNWMLQETPIDCSLHSVYFVDRNFGLAVGGYLFPFTRQGRGVVLLTTDGGKSWSMISVDHYPVFHRIRMFDPTTGFLAGESSEFCPSGLFSTRDGGRTWKPIVSDKTEGWMAVDFLDDKTGIGIDRLGSLRSLHANREIQTPQAGASRFTGLKLIPSKNVGANSVDGNTVGRAINGWLVGENGLVLSTTDSGFRWSVTPGKLPGQSAGLIDLKTVEVMDDKIWVAGSPGTFVYSSSDTGKTWRAHPTGLRAPIHKIVFTDAQTGWAVGDLGTILSTVDGGETWRVQRAGSSRLAMLGVFGQIDEIPLEAFVQLCAHHGYLGGVTLFFREPERRQENLESTRLARIHEALLRTGASGAWELGSFVLPATEIRTDFARLVEQLEREHDGKALQRIRERLVLTLRLWRPEIVLSSNVETKKGPVKELVLRELVEAVKQAADPMAYPQHVTELALEPWQVKKLHLVLPDGQLGDVNITTTEALIRLGQPIDEIVYASYGILAEHSETRWKDRPAIVGFSTQFDRASTPGSRDFFAGLTIPPGNDGRRAFLGSYADQWEAINLRIQQRRHALGIIHKTAQTAREKGLTASDVRLVSNAEELTRKIDKDAAVQVLFDMGRQYQEQGDWESAWEAYELIARQHAEHPFARQAFLWLMQYYAGDEIGWRKAKNNLTSSTGIEFTKEGAKAKRPVIQQVAGAELAGRHEEQQRLRDLEHRLDKTIAIGRYLDQKHPDLAADATFRFALASALRRRGWGGEAAKYYRTRGDRKFDDVWSMRARAEHWLSEPDRSELPPEQQESPMPTILCSYTTNKPYLDGQFEKQFDQGTWFRSQLYHLTPERPRQRLKEILKDKPATTGMKREAELRAQSKNFGTQVMFLYDSEYLYIGIRCKRAEGFSYPPIADKPRTRDADIDDQDRVEILLDIDRDYGTYYSLTVDSRGWAVDACRGDKSWNPEWYVARHTDKDFWYIESAIPLASLTDQPVLSNIVWNVGLRRIVPGIGIECWNAENSFNLREGLGFLIFE